MMSLVLILALALVSFLSSAFVILRIVIPILPPNPLSRRVPPSKFGLPNYRSLTPADKSHIWLASLDIIALVCFIWQALASGLSISSDITYDPISATRLWIALTTRQTCLFFIATITLLSVRLGRSVSFGPKHCLIWAPTIIFVGTGIAIAAILSKVGMNTLWGGLVVYSSTIAVLTTVLLGCLIGTLLLVRHNVNAAVRAEAEDNKWPPEKIRRSIPVEDIEALKEGSSWITSHRSSHGSRQNSISAFSFSTTQHSAHGTTAPLTGSAPSVLPKSAYWFGTGTPNSAALISQDSIPPVPRLPSPYRERPRTPPADAAYTDPDPFHRSPPREAKSSANSWLTSPSVSQATLTEFSFPTTRPGSPTEHEELTPNDPTPPVYQHRVSQSCGTTEVQPLSRSRVLGGYGVQGYLTGLSPKATRDVDISVFRCVAWTISIWLPVGLSFPYLFLASPTQSIPSSIAPILFTLSIAISSPLLALNLLLRSPLPIPAALFSNSYTPTPTMPETLKSISEVRIHPEMRARSSSITVVEGRRSGDVWITNGEAVDGRGKAARVLGLLVPSPRLAVLPPPEGDQNVENSAHLPMRDDTLPSIVPSSPSRISAEIGVARSRKDSKTSSYYSIGDESLAYKSQIMVAQRHYSAMAMTVHIPQSPTFAPEPGPSSTGGSEAPEGISTAVKRGFTRGHLRSQSASSSLQTGSSSMLNRFPLTPPPSTPLPPTPPSLQALHHSQSQASFGSGFSFRPIGNTNQIDSLSAGMLPLLVPGLKISQDMIAHASSSPPRFRSGSEVKTRSPLRDEEFGFAASMSFHSPQLHSTPARHVKRPRSGNRWKHMSLPSLGLGKEGIHSLASWKDDLVRVLDGLEVKTPSTSQQRRAVPAGETCVPNVKVHNPSANPLNPVDEEDFVQFGYAVTADDKRASGRSVGPTPPTSASVYSDGFATARSSMATMVEKPLNQATAFLPSTIQDQQDRPPTPSRAETINKARSYHLPIPPVRKSSIVYIKSDQDTPVPTVQIAPRASKQLPWQARISRKQSIPSTQKTFTKDGEPSPLRKLTLLGNRDLNSNGSVAGTPPLSISKKAKKQSDKENTRSGLRPLQLARSATAKARGLLRQDELLPDVVVRPPSSSGHTPFGYSFR